MILNRDVLMCVILLFVTQIAICFQLNGQLIHDHGYKMVGWRSGSCSGGNHQSWEKSPEGKIDLIKGLKNYIEINKNITPQEVKSLTLMIEEHQAMVDSWKPAKTPKELQDMVAQ